MSSGRSARTARATSRASRGLTSAPQRTDRAARRVRRAPRRTAARRCPGRRGRESGRRCRLPQSRKQGQQVALRAADAGQLVDVEDLHLEQPAVDGLELVCHPRRWRSGSGRHRRRERPSRAKLGVARELGQAVRERRRIADRLQITRSRRAGRRSPCRRRGSPRQVAPAASASIATTGVPSFAEVRSSASNDAYQGRHALLKADEAGSGRRRRARSASAVTTPRSSPSPTRRAARRPRGRRARGVPGRDRAGA